jgi:hypothetical protein
LKVDPKAETDVVVADGNPVDGVDVARDGVSKGACSDEGNRHIDISLDVCGSGETVALNLPGEGVDAGEGIERAEVLGGGRDSWQVRWEQGQGWDDLGWEERRQQLSDGDDGE